MDYAHGTKKLGQLLVERGWITGEQLIRAIQSQRMVGGRIGTCLLEMDVLTEERLLEALSEQLEVPSAGVDLLRGIEDETLELISPKVAHRCRAIPFFSNKKRINVATLEVHNLPYLDELRYCTDREVVPHIANEVRIFEALEKYYGFELPRRYGHLLDRLNRSRYLWEESAKVLFGTPEGDGMVWTDPEEAFEIPGLIRAASASSGATRRGRAASKAGADASPSSEGSPSDEPPSDEPPSDEPPSDEPQITLDDVDRLFGGAENQHQLGEILVRFAAQYFDRVALFKVMPDRIGGWKYAGDDIDQACFEALSLSPAAPSIFQELQQGKAYYQGIVPPLPVHLEMAQAWGGRPARGSLWVPIHVRGRLVSVLYGDRREQGVDGIDPQPFRRLADKASLAFELFILRRKVSTINA